jgi:hypothetical protein
MGGSRGRERWCDWGGRTAERRAGTSGCRLRPCGSRGRLQAAACPACRRRPAIVPAPSLGHRDCQLDSCPLPARPPRGGTEQARAPTVSTRPALCASFAVATARTPHMPDPLLAVGQRGRKRGTGGVTETKRNSQVGPPRFSFRETSVLHPENVALVQPGSRSLRPDSRARMRCRAPSHGTIGGRS